MKQLKYAKVKLQNGLWRLKGPIAYESTENGLVKTQAWMP